ncbi:hypothetical protein AKG11_03730 [Shinella sp. SUS2]|uniref:hypothetical protein n=1 Tax=unclassified Shinella TaxID=2643062 RepID=UPI000682FDAE|nr:MULTISPECIES: hypothetical protein [unclassified Shinella]KNY18252.1 hypothetical protein AKG11_03730 [Shinella sp. SUS2]KOC77447.1 hypothetical protein AKG10_01200 [Shinella sp. GWS1]
MADAVVITPPADHKVSPFFASRLTDWRKLRAEMESLANAEANAQAGGAGDLSETIDTLHDACRALEDEVHTAAPANALELVIKVEMLLTQGQINYDFHDGIKAEASRIVATMLPAGI